MLRNHGSSIKYKHQYIGYNYRLDEIQAVILSIKLKYLDSWIKRRQQIANTYNKLLSNNSDIKIPMVSNDRNHVYHLYVIQTKHRNKLLNHLKNNGIEAAVHYPIPNHKQNPYRKITNKNNLPVTEKVVKNILSLPLHPEMTLKDIKTIVNVINRNINK